MAAADSRHVGFEAMTLMWIPPPVIHRSLVAVDADGRKGEQGRIERSDIRLRESERGGVEPDALRILVNSQPVEGVTRVKDGARAELVDIVDGSAVLHPVRVAAGWGAAEPVASVGG